jgi:hypothetical protein
VFPSRHFRGEQQSGRFQAKATQRSLNLRGPRWETISAIKHSDGKSSTTAPMQENGGFHHLGPLEIGVRKIEGFRAVLGSEK